MSGFVLGVDGGGSKTHAVALDMRGRCVGFGSAGCGNHAYAGIEPACAEVLRAIDEARSASGLARERARVACMGLSGADFPDDFEMLRSCYSAFGVASEVVIVNDSIPAFRAGSSRPYGVVVILGSGANCAGIARDGSEKRYISQGYLFGDWGSGNWIGAEILHFVYRAWTGRGKQTVLTEMVRRHFAEDDLYELARRITRQQIPPSDIRLLTPLAFEAACEGDDVACDIVRRVGTEAGVSASAMMKSVGLLDTEIEVVLAGSVFNGKGSLLPDTVRGLVLAANPKAAVVRPKFEPVVGAGLLALERAGVDVGAEVMQRLEESLPCSLSAQ
jgi:N-acetylglucosamine kinase-like BadF-type ATPase